MKKIIITIVICAAAGMLCAQELTKEKVQREQYKTDRSRITKNTAYRVNEQFNDLTEVDVLDFTNAVALKVSPQIKSVADAGVSNAEYINYANTTAIGELLKKSPEALVVKFSFKGASFTVDLVKSDFLSDDFKIMSNDLQAVAGIQQGLHYQGVVRGEAFIAGFSFFKNEFSALISSLNSSTGTVEIGSMRVKDNTSGTHIIYADKDMKLKLGKPCMAGSLPQYKAAVEQMRAAAAKNAQTNVAEAPGDPLRCVTHFWETSFSYFQALSSNVQLVSNHAIAVFNNFQIIYNNENIGSRLNRLFIWTAQDPYGDNLGTFALQRTNFGANLAMLLSAGGGGGVAYLNTLCGIERFRYSFCGSMFIDPILPFPNFSWGVMVTAHEVGHNLGSAHTHDCIWNGNNTPLDGCGPAAGYSSGCNTTLPPGNLGGTIMSYCHLLSSVGINLTNGFGPQPGNVIRANVNSCISLTCGVESCPASVRLTTPIITGNRKYEAVNDVIAAALVSPTGGYVKLDAGREILLTPGFETRIINGTELSVYIDGCGGQLRNAENDYEPMLQLKNTTAGTVILQDQKFNIYPNPAHDVLSISIPHRKENIKSIEVYDMTGRLMSVQLRFTNPLSLNISALLNGSYSVKVKTDKNEYNARFIKN